MNPAASPGASTSAPRPPVLALTQGDPAGIGPEILLGLVTAPPAPIHRCLLVAERAALEALRPVLPGAPWERLVDLDPAAADLAERLDALDPAAIPVLDPVARERRVVPGSPTAADAAGAMAALDLGVSLVEGGVADALVTAPVSKRAIADHGWEGFVGHTDYLADRAGLEAYGRDYLMAFLAPGLRVALLSTHVPLARALELVTGERLLEALRCLAREVEGPIAVAGLDPHAGEGGLLGTTDEAVVAPAVAAARAEGIDAHGPESADSVFARARAGEFAWVLALYHDQGLIAVKTAAFGLATNWTLGLPYLRTSVDHGTAYAIAGRGEADAGPLARAVETTLELLAVRKRRSSRSS